MIVVDVGCMHQPPEESVYLLTRTMKPDILFGFDPDPALPEGVECKDGTLIVRRRLAAWVDGATEMPVVLNGIRTGVEGVVGPTIPAGNLVWDCPVIDLPAWLRSLPTTEKVVLKLDCEGAEYLILDRIAKMGLDETLLDLVLVEWHPPETAHGWYVPPEQRPKLKCRVENWEEW